MISPVVREDVVAIVALLGPDAERLAGKRLLLTGGTGFLGRYLLETVSYLNHGVLSEPCQCSVLTRDPSRSAALFPHLGDQAGVVWLKGDVRHWTPPQAGTWHYVVHGAAPSDAREFMGDPVGTMDVIVNGTKSVLEAAATPEAFLFISSGAVYGHQASDCDRLSEEDSGAPDLKDSRSCYGEAKRCAELLCRLFGEQFGVPVSIARLFALVGPGQDLNATSAVVDFIRQGLEGDAIRIRDAGQTLRSYCYIADAAAALWKLLLGPQSGLPVNVGSDLEVVSFVDLAHRIARCLGKTVTVEVGGAPATGVLGSRYVPDVSRLKQLTGYRPETGLDRALTRTIAWMRDTGKPVPVH